MYAAIPVFRGFYDHRGYEKWQDHLEDLFRYFSLTSKQKCCYSRIKLDEEAYYWWKDNHKFYGHWLILQRLLRARYAPHCLYVPKLIPYEADYNEPIIKPELEPELEIVVNAKARARTRS